MKSAAGLPFNFNVANAPIFVTKAVPDVIDGPDGRRPVVKLDSNESAFGPSPRAVAAVRARAAELHRYPAVGDEALRTAIADSLGSGLTPDNVMTGHGANEVLARIAGAMLEPGTECILCRPTFPVYEITARRAGAKVVYADLDAEGFTYRVDAILDAVTPRTRVLYLGSPNNPTGTTLSQSEMAEIMDHLPGHLLVVADEVYHDFVTVAGFPESLNYVHEGRSIAIIHSLSKAYGLAGLRLGYAVAPEEIARYLSRTRESFHLSAVTIAAGVAALGDEPHRRATVEQTVAGREWLDGRLRGLGVEVWPSQANFVLFRVPGLASAFAEQLLRRGVLVRPMAQFYLPRHVRVTVGSPAENERFVEALTDVLAHGEPIAEEAARANAGTGREFRF